MLFVLNERTKYDIINNNKISKTTKDNMKIFDVKSGGHNIKLYTNGIEKPKKIVLCLHGFNGDLWGDGFSKLKKRLSDADGILVCSFDSAGHGESEVKSIDMTLNLVVSEITDVVNFLEKHYNNIPIYFYAISYGGYRAMVAVSKNEYKNLKKIILVNPAVKMLKTLEKLKEFDYKTLGRDAVVPMKSSQNKYLSKKFLDDLNENNIFKTTYKTNVPTRLIIGKQDDLIERQDLLDFASLIGCAYEYFDDGHCLEDDESWKKIIEIIKE